MSKTQGYRRAAYDLNVTGIPQVLLNRIDAMSLRGAVTAMDLGCGRGRLSLYLARRGFHVTAVDSSAIAVRSLRKEARESHLKNVTVRKASFERLSASSFPPFNLVVAWRVAHIGSARQRERIRRLIDKMTVPGGYALVAVASDRCPTLALRRGQLKCAEPEPGTIRYRSHGAMHLKHYYSMRELKRKGQFGSLEIVAAGSVTEPSGHPEDKLSRRYWWLILKQPRERRRTSFGAQRLVAK